MVALGLHPDDRRREGIFVKHPHDAAGRNQVHRQSQRLERQRNMGGVGTPVDPDRDKPDQYGREEYQHEFLVGGRLPVARGEPHPFGEQRRVGSGEPPSAGGAEHRRGREECPRSRPLQRARRGEQHRTHRDDEE
jgi:hypothetical protein